jgi:Ala-tRNA(Pro) deacylase
MTIAPTLQRYLDSNVVYDVITHEPTPSSARTAEACHVSGDQLAKAIVLRREGGYLLAVVPASHHIRLADLKAQLGDEVELANEQEFQRLFPDCMPGAVPPIGQCYDLDVVIDESIQEPPEIYLEGGDHTTVIRLSQVEFAKLMADARRFRFSAHD